MKRSPTANDAADNATRFRLTLLGFSLLMLVVVNGCARREMTINTQPQGALVYLNNEEVGRTPLTRDFDWYGKYDVVVRKEGFETLVTKQDVAAPWWQWVPFDLFAELAPWRPVDRQSMTFRLSPKSGGEAESRPLVLRATAMRTELNR